MKNFIFGWVSLFAFFLTACGGGNQASSDSAASPAAVLQLAEEKRDTYWLTFKNFYVITRYNRSPRYAMAVYELSQEIKKGMDNT